MRSLSQQVTIADGQRFGCRETRAIASNAPHFVHPMPFPRSLQFVVATHAMRIAMLLYDVGGRSKFPRARVFRRLALNCDRDDRANGLGCAMGR